MTNYLRFIKYFLAGGTAALFDIGIFMGLIRMGQSYVVAGSVSFIVATFVNYVLSTRYVFRDRKGTGLRTVVATYAVSAVGLVLNQLILWLAIDHFHFFPFYSKLLATGMVFFWNYFIRNYVVFKN